MSAGEREATKPQLDRMSSRDSVYAAAASRQRRSLTDRELVAVAPDHLC